MIIGDIETTEKVEYEDLLKNYYEKMEIIEEQDKELERLNNVINELEKELKERYLDFKDSECEEIKASAYEDISILERLKKLKGSDKE